MMDVELVNDGPVTILLDSRKTFWEFDWKRIKFFGKRN
jgi:hypothetical protein